MNKRERGTGFETAVKEYLEQQGVVILESNFRCRFGEVDLIGRESGYLVFIEVKYRSGRAYGLPEEAVDHRKRSRICKTASFYLYTHGRKSYTPIRFDVVAVEAEKIRWHKNAFAYTQ